MTEWEQRQIFDRLDKVIDLLGYLVKMYSCLTTEIGVDCAREGAEDYTAVVNTKDVADEDGDSTKARIAKADRDRYYRYRECGGTLKWNEWRRKDKKERCS